MEEDYYKPNQEDLFIGYETYFIKDVLEPIIPKNLELIKLSGKQLASFSITSFRTKYLDETDLNSLGFRKCLVNIEVNEEEKITEGYSLCVEENKCYELVRLNNNKIILFHKYYRNQLKVIREQIFRGKCPSINELKRILKQVINQEYLNF